MNGNHREKQREQMPETGATGRVGRQQLRDTFHKNLNNEKNKPEKSKTPKKLRGKTTKSLN